MRFIIRSLALKFFVIGILVSLVFPPQIPAWAATTLTVTPITWNIIGLDSNSPTTGPYRFPVGARVCSSVATTNVAVNWVWDTANANINLRPGSLSSFTIASIGAGSCSDAYFEVEVTQVAGAYDTARRYHITATDTSGTASTPTPRELYVEHLISQNRNSITDVKLNGTSIPAGGTMTLMVGNTYTIELTGGTATQGYEQFEEFINFPNTIFQVLSVSTTYAANTSIYVTSPNDKLYADACLWENDPNSPNYRACVGTAGKTGGAPVVTTYTVRILSGGGTTQTLNTLLYDFSGSSFHYNSDYSTGTRFAAIVDPTNVTISKSFSPNPTNVNGISALTITITNPNGGAISGFNFTDPLPSNMAVASTPNATTTGCGSPAFAPAAAATSLSFSNGTIAANASCVIKVNVTTTAVATYTNTTNSLFVDALNTTKTATANLTVNADPPAGTGICNLTLARWNFPSGMSVTAPTPTTSTVTSSASAGVGISFPPIYATDDNTIAPAGTGSWASNGSISSGATLTTSNDEYFEFALNTTGVTAAYLKFDALGKTGQHPNGVAVYYGTSNSRPEIGTSVIISPTVISAQNAWFSFGAGDSIAFTSGLNGSGTTYFRIYGFNAGNQNSGTDFNLDNVLFTGCSAPIMPTIAKAFSPDPVAVNGTSTLTFTLTNTNTTQLTGATFTDSLPTGLQVAATPSASTTCTGSPTWAPAAGNTTLNFSGGTIPASGSCTVSVNITATTSGPHNNVSGFLSTTESGINKNSFASASLTAVLPPVISKQFAPTPILANGTSTLTFLITNPNQNNSLSGVAFTDTFPTSPGNMVVAATPNGSTSCGGTFTPSAGAGSISFTGGTIAGGGTCTVKVDVTAPTTGTYNNTSGNVSHIINAATINGNTASASLTVNPPNPQISIFKQVGPTATGPWSTFLGVATGNSVHYQFTVENVGDVDLTSVSVTDPTLSGLGVNLSACAWANLAKYASVTCVVGPVFAVAGTNPNTATATASYGATTKTDTSTATYATTGLTIAKSVLQGYFTAAGNVLNYSYVVTNSGSAPLVGPVTVADNKSTNETCPTVSTVGDLDAYLDPGESITCTATYTVTAGDVTAKSVTNTASATAGGVTSNTDSKTVNLAPDLTVVKSNNVSGVMAIGSTYTWTVTITNSVSAGSTSFTNTQIILTDDLPTSGATYAVGAVTIAGGTTGTIDCSIASNILTCSANGTVSFPPGGSASIPITVTPTVVGSLSNPKSGGTCAVDPNGVISEISDSNNSCATNTVTVQPAADLVVTKDDGITQIMAGGTTTYTLTLTNNGPNAANNATIHDAAAAGMTKASIGACIASGGAVCPVVGAGAGQMSITNLQAGTVVVPTLPIGGVITFTVPVTITASSGLVTNTFTATPPSGTSDPTPATASDTDTVVAPPTISKSFGASSIVLGNSTVLTFTITNPNTTVALTGVGFSDTLPAGLTIADSSSSPCSGTLTTTATTGVINLSGASIAASGTCTFSVTTTGSTAGVKNNTTGAISSTEGGIGTTSNTATVTVVAPPTISKSFGASSIALGNSTTLTFTITNPNTTVALTGVGFSDTLPAGLTILTSSSTKCSGTLTTTAATGVIALSSASINANSTCIFSVTVTGSAAGVWNNTTDPITSTQGGIGTTSNTATVTVVAPPTISKSFGASTVPISGTTILTFTITNPNITVALNGVGFSDTLLSGLTIVTSSSAQCGGTLTTTAGTRVIALSGASVAANSTCTFSVTVTGSTSGVKNNTTGAITSTEGGTGTTSNTATVTVVSPPTISKSFGVSSIILNGSTTLSFTITNPNTGTVLTGVGFSDTLPSGLAVIDSSNPQCSGTLTTTAATRVITLSGASISASSTCTFSVTVTGSTAGVKNNTTGAVTSTEGGTGTTSNTATVTVVAPPTISKSFGASTVALNGTTLLTFTVSNPNTTVALTGVGFSDTLPSGLTVNTSSSSKCSGTLNTTAGTGVIALSGASIAASGTCAFNVTVTGSTTGVKNNTTDAISSTEGGSGSTSNTATVTVVAPPTISKSFGTSTVALNGTTTLSFWIANPNGNTILNGVAFSDTLPSGLTVATSSSTQCGGTLTTTNGTGVIALSGASINASSTCTFNVTVTGSTAGVKNNTTGTVTSTEGGTGTTSNTATVTVVAPPTIAKSFGASSIVLGNSTTLTFTITNPNTTVALSGVGFSDTLPSGLTVADSSNPQCSGTLTTTAATGVIALNNASIAASGTCTFSMTVTGSTAGVKNNTTGVITSTEGGTGTTSNTTSVTVIAPPTIAKSFGASTVALNGTTLLTFTVTNPNTTVALTGVAFSDTLPSGLTVATSSSTKCSGTLNTTNPNTIILSGASIAASATCTFSVTVTGSAVGVQNNTTGAISSTGGGAGTTSNTATVTVVAPPTISKSFGTSTITLNGSTTLSFWITNPNGNTVLNGVGFSDTLPSGLTVATSSSTQCGSTLNTTSGTGVITLSGATIAAGGTCTFNVTVTGSTAGVKNNTTGAVTSTEGGTGTTSNTASVTVISSADLVVTKTNGVTNVISGSGTTYTLTLTNNGPSAANAATLSDPAVTGLTKTSIGTCTASGGAVCPTVGTGAGQMSITNLEAGTVQVPTLPSSGSISFTVTASVTATSGNVTNTFSATPPTGTTDPTPATVSDTDTVTQNADLSITKTVSNATPIFETNTTFTVTVSNAGPGQATNVVVTDLLPTGLTFVSSSVSQGSYTSSTGVWTVGTINSGASTTLQITVKVTALGTLTNTAKVTSADQPDPISANNTISVTVGAIFDPPSVLKTVNAAGLPELEWKMVWINSHNTTAIGVQVFDPIPAGTTYSSGSVVCDARGSSTTTTCIYDPALNRIFWQGNIGPDVGATVEADAANEVVITFRTSVGAGVTTVNNTASAITDSNGDGNFSGEPTTSTTNSNIASWQGARLPNTGEDLGDEPNWIYLSIGLIIALIFGGLCVLGVFLSRRRRPWIFFAGASLLFSMIACAFVGAGVMSTLSDRSQGVISPDANRITALAPTIVNSSEQRPTESLVSPQVALVPTSTPEIKPALTTIPLNVTPTAVTSRLSETPTPRSAPDTTSITRILIPSQSVNAVVKYIPFDGFTWQMDGIKTDVAWLGGTSAPGLGSNTVLAAHVLVRNIGRGPFFDLERLKRGAEVKIQTQKSIYSYTIREQKIVEATAIDITYATTKPQLTLITCTEWDSTTRTYSHRLVVFADLVKVEPLPTSTGH